MAENRLLILTLSQSGSTNLIAPLAFDGRGQDMDRVKHPEDRASRVAEPPSFFLPSAPCPDIRSSTASQRIHSIDGQKCCLVCTAFKHNTMQYPFKWRVFPGMLNKFAIHLILTGPMLSSHWARTLDAIVSSFWSVLKLLPRIANDGVNPSCHFVAQLSGSYQPHYFPV